MLQQAQENVLSYEYVQREFKDVGESINEDLSTVSVSMVRDVHTDSFDLDICIYGRDCDVDSAPIVEYLYSGESDIFDADVLRAGGGVAQYKVLSLFDQGLLELFHRSGLKIHWNDGDVTHVEIDPISLENVCMLFAQDR